MPRSMPSMPSCEISAVIPASGKGGRFGRPKARAVYKGKTFAEHIISTLRQAGIKNHFVADVYDTPDMLSTLRLAFRDMDFSGAKGFLIWPVDHPFVRASTVSSLCKAFMASPDAVVRPSFEGAHGHPVVIPAWLDLNENDAGEGLAGLMRAQVCTMIDVPVSDKAILRNINYLRDLED
jgi:CTP:molybdopterin cytidylyltransferase MocA